MKHRALSLFLLALALLGVPPAVRAFDPRAEPEAATTTQQVRTAQARRQMAVTANPHASETALAMLRQGGSAVDATIAAQLVLNLVEPQSSGLGGGAFLLHWDAGRKRLTSLDGRETAPAAATPGRFLRDGEPLPFAAAVPGGLSVGVPGLPRLLAEAHARHGRLPWATLFEPAIALAERGFIVSPRLAGLLAEADPQTFDATARAYFFDPEGRPRPAGWRLRNPAFAATLRAIAAGGADAVYRGPLAGEIVATVTGAERNPGDLTTEDLAGYRVLERPPLCFAYRRHQICGMGPPSSGLVTIAQTLQLLEPFDLGREPLGRPALHLIAEAEKLAFADRDRYVADGDFVPLPEGLLDPAYLAARRRLIDPARSMGVAPPGEPPRRRAAFGRDATIENHGTSHISIVDADGNAAALTTSIEAGFGARLMAGGFLLNNELTDFSFRPADADGRPVANRVEAGKRPRSSMAPLIVFGPDGRLAMVAGSPGGSRIILYLVKALIARIDWGLDAGAIAALPNFGSRNGPVEIEAGPQAEAIAADLRRFGHEAKIEPMTSGLNLLLAGADGFAAAADPRREGVPLGD